MIEIISQLYLHTLTFLFNHLVLAEKRTACLEEVRKLKEVDSDEFLNKRSLGDEPCHASLAVSGMPASLKILLGDFKKQCGVNVSQLFC